MMEFLDNDLIKCSTNDTMLDLVNTQKEYFSKIGLPGRRITPIPHTSNLYHTKPSQLPYNAKLTFLYYFLYFLLYIG